MTSLILIVIFNLFQFSCTVICFFFFFRALFYEGSDNESLTWYCVQVSYKLDDKSHHTILETDNLGSHKLVCFALIFAEQGTSVEYCPFFFCPSVPIPCTFHLHVANTSSSDTEGRAAYPPFFAILTKKASARKYQHAILKMDHTWPTGDFELRWTKHQVKHQPRPGFAVITTEVTSCETSHRLRGFFEVRPPGTWFVARPEDQRHKHSLSTRVKTFHDSWFRCELANTFFRFLLLFGIFHGGDAASSPEYAIAYLFHHFFLIFTDQVMVTSGRITLHFLLTCTHSFEM
jgi:hypothetical protein